MLVKSDIGIILKQRDNVAPENFISVALGIQIAFGNDEISGAKAMCNARPDQDRNPNPQNDLVQARNDRHNVHFPYGIICCLYWDLTLIYQLRSYHGGR